MTVIAIVAASLNNVIGVDGKLPWDSPSDLARFKVKTMGHIILMGRKTWESLPQTGKGRLPGRTCYILTKECKFNTTGCAGIFTDIGRAVPELLRKAARKGQKIFIIGGAEIFTQALELDLIDEVWLTRMDITVPTLPETVLFPQKMLSKWPAYYSSSPYNPQLDPPQRFERYTNPNCPKKEEPEMSIIDPLSIELDQAKEIITNQQKLLARVVRCYMQDKPVSYKLACDCSAYCDQNWGLVERQPQTGEVEGPSPLLEVPAVTASLAAVGECLKAGLEIGGPISIDSLTVNINIGK